MLCPTNYIVALSKKSMYRPYVEMHISHFTHLCLKTLVFRHQRSRILVYIQQVQLVTHHKPVSKHSAGIYSLYSTPYGPMYHTVLLQDYWDSQLYNPSTFKFPAFKFRNETWDAVFSPRHFGVASILWHVDISHKDETPCREIISFAWLYRCSTSACEGTGTSWWLGY